MDEEEVKEINQDDTANTPKDSEVLIPLEVKVVNQVKKEVSDYDSRDDMEYDSLGITQEDLEEFEKGE